MSSSADGMIYTDEESAPEMPITELETELTRLKMLLADLPLTWKAYAPGVFMDEMRRLQKKFNNLTPETVLRYVDLGGGFQNDLDALQVHEADLKNSPAPASLEPWRNRRLPVMRQCMISHVINVQNQLKGQS